MQDRQDLRMAVELSDTEWRTRRHNHMSWSETLLRIVQCTVRLVRRGVNGQTKSKTARRCRLLQKTRILSKIHRYKKKKKKNPPKRFFPSLLYISKQTSFSFLRPVNQDGYIRAIPKTNPLINIFHFFILFCLFVLFHPRSEHRHVLVSAFLHNDILSST